MGSLCWQRRAQYADLLRRIPDGANTLAVINAETLFASPLATAEKWREESAQRFSKKAVLLPPSALRLVMAANLDLGSMRPTWRTALMHLKQEPDLSRLIRERGGLPDTFENYRAVALPRDAVLVLFDKQTVGMMSPANRQQIVRWVREGDARKSPALSPYLSEMAAFAENAGAQVILAFDLSDIYTAEQIQAMLQQSSALEGKSVGLAELSQLMASIRGVTLGINVGERAYGKLRVDFRQDASLLKSEGKALLLGALGNHGAMIDEMNEWEAEVQGNTLFLGGYLEESGMRRVATILAVPPDPNQPQPAEAEKTASGTSQSVGYTTLNYFQAVGTVLDDLRGRKGSSTNINQYGIWFDKYARQVDDLPLLNVDPEMVDYGANVADSLRQASDAIKGIGMRKAVRQAGMPSAGTSSAGYGGYGYGGYGYGYGAVALHQSNPQRQAIGKEERVRGASSAGKSCGKSKRPAARSAAR